MDHAQMSSPLQPPVAGDRPVAAAAVTTATTAPSAPASSSTEAMLAPDGGIIRVCFENEVFDVEPAPIEEIRQTLAEHYPAVRAAAVQEGTAVVDGQTVKMVTFRKQVGTKGAVTAAARRPVWRTGWPRPTLARNLLHHITGVAARLCRQAAPVTRPWRDDATA